MNICYLMPPIEYYSPRTGGALSTCAMQQGRRLIARGHNVTVLTAVRDESYPVGKVIPIYAPQRDSLPKWKRAISRLRRKVTGYEWMYYEYYLASIQQELKRLNPQPDVVICFNDFRTPILVKKLLPQKKVYLRISNEVPTSMPDLSVLSQSVEAIFCVSTYIRDWLLKTHPEVPASKTVVLCNGADLDAFFPRPDFLEVSTPIRALFVGRINPDKGPDIAADTVARLRAEGLPVQLSAAGMKWWYGSDDGTTDPYFQSLKEKFRVAEAEHLGHVDRFRVPEVFRTHDVFLMPARWQEPMSQTVFEAMASGCAVIASRRGGIPEACGDAAILLDPEQPETWVEALRSLVTNPDLLRERKQMSIARARVMTWDKNTDIVERVLQGELQDRSIPTT